MRCTTSNHAASMSASNVPKRDFTKVSASLSSISSFRYGKSSVEYGMAGGVPKTQRSKGLRGQSPTPNAEQPSFVASLEGKNGKKTVATN
ncbi:hypothetical protein LC608_13145 [Nostoc sp. XA010]|uniref:hypothetical protein n=1 Tax=Nostoc sp. XA010 TaxID=2780407 RepID=UPI001E4099CF|nr:hypothetical protein [Nostoc sp. XA010]MCC5657918.1 hypothetical protein [Nostoc sp. XA010]